MSYHDHTVGLEPISVGTHEMIGRFWYTETPCETHLAVRLAWFDGLACARLEPPPDLIDAARLHNLPIRADDEFMQLPYAMSLAVLVAALAKAQLTFTGDASAWPQEWGELEQRPRTSRARRSH